MRWGIIGVGDVTERKSGPGFQQAERSELVAVMRRRGDLAADYARRHDVPHWYDDADELINDPDVDAVYVATPPDSHKEYTIRVARAGKAVYVEKPMARTALECEEMISACDEAGVALFVAYYRRAMPRFVTVKELLGSGRIGQLRSVSIRNEQPAPVGEADNGGWRLNPEISGGGYFVDLGSHIHLLDWLLGPVTYAAGIATNRGAHYPAEDLVTGVFTFRSGVAGTGVWNYDSFQHQDQIEITGTAGALHFLLLRRASTAGHRSRGRAHRGAVSRDGSIAPHPGGSQCSDRSWRVTQHRAERSQNGSRHRQPAIGLPGESRNQLRSPEVKRRRRPIAMSPDATTRMAAATSQSPDDPRAVGAVVAVGAVAAGDGCGASEGAVDGPPAASAVKVKLPEIG